MNHRERYRSIVPEDAYIITYSDLASCCTCAAAKRVANEIYYKIGSSSYSSDAQKDGTAAHAAKEKELAPSHQNEVKMAYNMAGDYYLCGTMDRYHIKDWVVEDFKTTTSPASVYPKTRQVEVYAFLALNNNMVVHSGRYTTIDKSGNALDSVDVPINVATTAECFMSYILPRFNMIKTEIENLRRKYVRTDGITEDVCSINA